MRKSIKQKSLPLGLAAVLVIGGVVYAQGRGAGADYSTTGVDAQRTSWARADRFISKDNFAKGGFQLQWKLKISNQPRELTSIIGGTTSGGGLSKPLNVIVSTNNTLTTVDNDTGIQGWVRHFDAAMPAGSTMACPGGLTANATRSVALTAAAPAANGAAGGRAPSQYMSVVGEPGAGLPHDVTVRAARGGATPAPAGAAAPGGIALAAPGGAAAAPGGGAGNAAGRGAATPTYKSPFGAGRFGSGNGFYVITSDGMLHTMADGSGKELQAPLQFLPANAHISDLTAIPENNDEWHSYVVYASTVNSCGGVPNRVWAIDLAQDDHPITHVDTGASPVGDPAFSSDGTLFVAIGRGQAGSGYSNAVIALEPKTLKVKDWFTDPNADFASTPTIIKHGDKEIVAAAAKNGRIYLLDASSLGGSDHKTPLAVSAAMSGAKTDYAPGALASWEDSDGTAFVAEPFVGAGPSGVPANGDVTNGGIVAFKLVDDGGKLSLSPAWVSQDMISPLPPMVVNGVMFALSGGEYHPAAGASMTASQRAKESVPAILYALDVSTGKQLWTSGAAITSFVADTPVWVGAGQVYVATYDNTVYAFGFPEERYVSQN